MRTGAANHPKRVKPTQTVAQPRPGLVRHSGMPLPRLALVLAALAALLAIAAPVALADPPWATPAPLPRAGHRPAAAPAPRHGAALRRRHRPRDRDRARPRGGDRQREPQPAAERRLAAPAPRADHRSGPVEHAGR